MGTKNEGSFFHPKNVLTTVATGGIGYLAGSYARNATPDTPKPVNQIPQAPAPTMTTANPQDSEAQRQKRLQALQYGFASTITNPFLKGRSGQGLKTALGA